MDFGRAVGTFAHQCSQWELWHGHQKTPFLARFARPCRISTFDTGETDVLCCANLVYKLPCPRKACLIQDPRGDILVWFIKIWAACGLEVLLALPSPQFLRIAHLLLELFSCMLKVRGRLQPCIPRPHWFKWFSGPGLRSSVLGSPQVAYQMVL